jgi:hypothetical protein
LSSGHDIEDAKSDGLNKESLVKDFPGLSIPNNIDKDEIELDLDDLEGDRDLSSLQIKTHKSEDVK